MLWHRQYHSGLLHWRWEIVSYYAPMPVSLKRHRLTGIRILIINWRPSQVYNGNTYINTLMSSYWIDANLNDVRKTGQNRTTMHELCAWFFESSYISCPYTFHMHLGSQYAIEIIVVFDYRDACWLLNGFHISSHLILSYVMLSYLSFNGKQPSFGITARIRRRRSNSISFRPS